MNPHRRLVLLILGGALVGVVATLLVTSPWSNSDRPELAPVLYKDQQIWMGWKSRDSLAAFPLIRLACEELRPAWGRDDCVARIMRANPGFEDGMYESSTIKITIPGDE